MQRMVQIVESVPDLGPGSRILDVGSGTGCLIPFFRQRGVQDVLAVDLAPDMLAKVCAQVHYSLAVWYSAPISACLWRGSMLPAMFHADCHSCASQSPV